VYIDYGPDVEAERTRRKREGIATLRWYVCHGCGWEALVSDGVRPSWGCGNPDCLKPAIHVHSDLDGEKPKTL
jgi:hypothetical protein